MTEDEKTIMLKLLKYVKRKAEANLHYGSINKSEEHTEKGIFWARTFIIIEREIFEKGR